MAQAAGSKADVDAAVRGGGAVVAGFADSQSDVDSVAGSVGATVFYCDRSVAKEFKVSKFPTFIAYKGGSEVGRVEEANAASIAGLLE